MHLGHSLVPWAFFVIFGALVGPLYVWLWPWPSPPSLGFARTWEKTGCWSGSLQNSLDLPVPSPAVAKTVWAAQCLALRLQTLPGPRSCVKGDGELEKLAAEMVKVRAKTS